MESVTNDTLLEYFSQAEDEETWPGYDAVIDVSCDSTNKTVGFALNTSGTGRVDWGDSSTDDYTNRTSTAALYHTYSTAGDYQIQFFGVDGGYFKRITTSATVLHRQRVVRIRWYDATNFTTCTQAFNGCTNLVRARIDNMHIDSNSQAYRLFYGCTKLEKVTGNLVKATADRLSQEMFYNCQLLTSIPKIPANITQIVASCFYNCYVLNMAQFPTGVTTVGNNAFRDCRALSCTIPPTITTFGTYSFYHCYEAVFEELNPMLDIVPGSCFYQCYKLQISRLPPALAQINSYGFYQCSGLPHDLVIPAATAWIDIQAFTGCGLTSVTFMGRPHYIHANVFYSNSNLTTYNCCWAQTDSWPNGYWPYTSTFTSTATWNYNYDPYHGANNVLVYVTTEPNYQVGLYISAKTGTVTINWGDGSSTDSVGTTVAWHYHTYANPGTYAVECTGVVDYFRPVNNDINSAKALVAVPRTDVDNIGTTAYAYSTSTGYSALKNINMPNITQVKNRGFFNCVRNRVCHVPELITAISQEQIQFDSSTYTALFIPEKLKTINARAFRNMGTSASTRPTTLVFEGTPTTLDSTAFTGCTWFTDIYVPWADGAVAGAPWGATNATVHYGTGWYSDITITTTSANYKYLSGVRSRTAVCYVYVSWGDDTREVFYLEANTIRPLSHTYKTAGSYRVRIFSPQELYGVLYSGVQAYTATTGGNVITGYTTATAPEYFMNYQYTGCATLPWTEIPADIPFQAAAATACQYLFAESGATFSSLPTSMTYVPQGCFRHCEHLQLTTLPSTITTIYQYAFYQAHNLPITDIPASVTTIGAYAFRDCWPSSSDNHSITFHGKPTSLASNTFYVNPGLKHIYVPWSSGEVAGAPWSASYATIHYNSPV